MTMVMPVLDGAQCKVCGSRLTVRDGRIKGIQRWKCKSCSTNFLDNHAWYHMKTPTNHVTSAIRMYYQGASLNAIRKQILLDSNYCPSTSTVYQWIVKYSHAALLANSDFHPKVGNIWIVDETSMKIFGQLIALLDVIDEKTHFLLASRVSLKISTKEIRMLMKQAVTWAAKTPKLVIVDRILPLMQGRYSFKVERSFGASDYHPLFEWRAKLMSDLKRFEKVIEFADGWLYYYNYFRPQESLGGKTPSEAANVKFVRQMKAINPGTIIEEIPYYSLTDKHIAFLKSQAEKPKPIL